MHDDRIGLRRGDVALVTGGTRGIGAAIARALAGDGIALVLTYRDDVAAARALESDLRDAGATVRVVRADVAHEPDVASAFDLARSLGTLRGAVLNAGITGGFARVADLDAATLAEVLAINVAGAFLGAREAVRAMSMQRGGTGGAIVTIGWRAARLGAPGDYVHYAASKAAIETLTLGLAKEVAAEGIRVNGVAPGLVATDIHARGGRPERLAALARAARTHRRAPGDCRSRALAALARVLVCNGRDARCWRRPVGPHDAEIGAGQFSSCVGLQFPIY